MSNTEKPDTAQYSVTVIVPAETGRGLHAEQARRTLKGQKKPTIAGLASELLVKSVQELGK